MSVVTDMFLMTGVNFDPGDNPEDEDAVLFDQINDWLHLNCSGQELRRLDRNHTAYGGSKVFQASIWSGAFNYLDIDLFIDFLKTLDFPDWVQVIYQREEDDGFTLEQIYKADAT